MARTLRDGSKAVAKTIQAALSRSKRLYPVFDASDDVVAQHIEPIRTENETLRAERDAAIARAEEAEEEARDARYKADCAEEDECDALSRAEEAESKLTTLTAKLAQAEGEIATAQEALRLAEGPLSWLARDLHGSAVVARALAAVRAALTTPEHPHGD